MNSNMAACEMYKRPYLLNRSTDSHKICGKMFASLTLFTESTIKVCEPFPLKENLVNTLAVTYFEAIIMNLVQNVFLDKF